jgi:dipeptidyl aminopeptidase/acylaminoacyl peptidase
MILDLNPNLKELFFLGRVEHVVWRDPDGRQWSGLLYYPVHYAREKRFPLVIQTHGHAPVTEFSLYGPGGIIPGLGPGISVYTAQILANLDIVVLQMSDMSDQSIPQTRSEPELYMRSFEAAIKCLLDRGVIDHARVGLMGHSRMGWKVEYALTHTDFRYAAAIAADNMDAGYLQAAFMSWKTEYTEQANEAPPFGRGLEAWLQNSPAFNAERMRTPLQIQVTTSLGGLSSLLFDGWEMFTRLRKLGKPVELYAIPDLPHGSHYVQNPAQCLAGQRRAVDWWTFWLSDLEDPAESKTEQYESWKKMRTCLHQDTAAANLTQRG